MIYRAEHTDNYTIISNEILSDSALSDGAKILLLYMLSCKDDWKFSMKGLASCLGLSLGTINSRVQELNKAGYIKKRRPRTEKGIFTSCEWDIYECPHSNLSICGENHIMAEPHYGSSTYGEIEHITNTNNKQVLNITSTKGKKKVFVPPTVEEVSAYCSERNNSIDPEAFVAFYQSKGWKVGKNPMKDWKSAVITWEKRQKKDRPRTGPIQEEDPFDKLIREERKEGLI